jgi:CRISPR-associated protein Csm2
VKEKGLTTSQIRNAYGLVKQMQMSGFDEHEFALLKPKLVYAAARAGKDGAHQLGAVLGWGIDAVGSDPAQFERFVDFFEAILAYHKAAGGT